MNSKAVDASGTDLFQTITATLSCKGLGKNTKHTWIIGGIWARFETGDSRIQVKRRYCLLQMAQFLVLTRLKQVRLGMHECPIMHKFCEFHFINPTTANKTMCFSTARSHFLPAEGMPLDGLHNKKQSTFHHILRFSLTPANQKSSLPTTSLNKESSNTLIHRVHGLESVHEPWVYTDRQTPKTGDEVEIGRPCGKNGAAQMGKSDINVGRNNEATDGPRGKHVQEDSGHEQPNTFKRTVVTNSQNTFKRTVVTNSQKPVRMGYTHTTYVKVTLLGEAHLVINTRALPSSARKPLPHGIN
jgi:hypothetical protein